MQRLVQGFRKFQSEVYPKTQELFQSLQEGQKPEVLLITCSDSRIDPALVTQTMPGELFVLRNAGNLVPRHGQGTGGEAATIEFAVRALGVQHVVVCGHSHCGAMAAVLDPGAAAELPAVRAWLEAAGPQRVSGTDAGLSDQIRFNVISQLENLRTHPAIREAERAGKIRLHGWVYDFASGDIHELREGSGEFSSLLDRDPARLSV